MNILIIGNGFDLAHGLATKYSDFLSYCHQIDLNKLSDDNTLSKSLKMNFWLSHFLLRSKEIGETWIDFEEEILSAITQISRSARRYLVSPRMLAFLNNNNDKTQYVFIPKLFWNIRPNEMSSAYMFSLLEHSIDISQHSTYFKQQLCNLANESKEYILFQDKSHSEQTNVLFKNINGFVNYVYDELRRFTDALEYYLYLINKTAPAYYYFIRDKITFSNVISFNYTKTFERLYPDNSQKTIYLHGNINGMGTNESNIVLGTRSFNKPDDPSDMFSIFKKSHQRQRYNTIKDYQLLLRNLSLTGDRRDTISIFGHSLNYTDRFLLNNILSANSKAFINIYYHNLSSKIRLIDSIYALLGEKDAESRVCFYDQHDRKEGLLVPYK